MEATTTDAPPDTARSMRVRVGMTQEDVARRSRTSVRTICYAETARREPSIRKARAIADALGVTPGTHVDGIERQRLLNRTRNFRLHSKTRRGVR